MTDLTTATRGVMFMRYDTDEEPSRVIVELGEDTDDRSGYAATASAYHDFGEALAQLHDLRRHYPDACMRYMSNDPDLGFPPYWEVDHDALAMAERIMGDVRPVTFQALKIGGLSQIDAIRISGLWQGRTEEGSRAET